MVRWWFGGRSAPFTIVLFRGWDRFPPRSSWRFRPRILIDLSLIPRLRAMRYAPGQGQLLCRWCQESLFRKPTCWMLRPDPYAFDSWLHFSDCWNRAENWNEDLAESLYSCVRYSPYCFSSLFFRTRKASLKKSLFSNILNSAIQISKFFCPHHAIAVSPLPSFQWTGSTSLCRTHQIANTELPLTGNEIPYIFPDRYCQRTPRLLPPWISVWGIVCGVSLSFSESWRKHCGVEMVR